MNILKTQNTNALSWYPSATMDTLKTRAAILNKVRAFFSMRNVLEVETPLIAHTSVTDPYIQSMEVLIKQYKHEKIYYLQTSPEYAMKRLLAAGVPDIYQLCKAFRQEESGRFHNPEFSILEWYRIGFDHHDLMTEVDELLQLILETKPALRISYRDLFITYLNIDPHQTSLDELNALAKTKNLNIETIINDVDTLLQLLMSHCIEPFIGQTEPIFIYDFPKSQAALARIKDGNPPVASRFEVYFKGIELANGFHELNDAEEQRVRFLKNNEDREKMNLAKIPLDEYFLQCLPTLPDCSGVALGFDRLVMLSMGVFSIKQIISFDFDRI